MTTRATDLTPRPLPDRGQPTDVTDSPGPFVVVHSLTSLVGMNLNMDMDHLPKTLHYGGAERIRVSSQSLARAAREYLRTDGTQQHAGAHALSTRSLPTAVTQQLEAEHGVDAADAHPLAALVVAATGLSINPSRPGQTKVMAYVPADAPARLARIVMTHLDDLDGPREAMEDTIAEWVAASQGSGTSPAGDGDPGTPLSGLPGELVTAAQDVLAPGTVEEIALFGRMLTELPSPERRIFSAAHIAHGFGADPLNRLTDEFTAHDDYQEGGVFSGSGMLGRQYLVSGTLYRQAALDRHQLRQTLALSGRSEADVEALAQSAERRWTRAIVRSLPKARRSRHGSAPRPALAVVATCDEALTAGPAFEEPVTSQPAGPHAAARLAAYLHHLGLRQGTALWQPPAGEAPPELPDVLTLKGY
ncbi:MULTISPECIES: type I-E CRISPR-associated protein Cas7/Cse4/CasC [unclassified Streptomyces]|uniref:type I-E CRISPR-associated protein Cas7/Cse4/CasC n=1 Tax=unclassified Streptomyces TaxID=2593676 RepID=UPI00379EBD51